MGQSSYELASRWSRRPGIDRFHRTARGQLFAVAVVKPWNPIYYLAPGIQYQTRTLPVVRVVPCRTTRVPPAAIYICLALQQSRSTMFPCASESWHYSTTSSASRSSGNRTRRVAALCVLALPLGLLAVFDEASIIIIMHEPSYCGFAKHRYCLGSPRLSQDQPLTAPDVADTSSATSVCTCMPCTPRLPPSKKYNMSYNTYEGMYASSEQLSH